MQIDFGFVKIILVSCCSASESVFGAAKTLYTPICGERFAFLETIETIFRRLVVKKENEPEMSADIDNLHPIGMF